MGVRAAALRPALAALAIAMTLYAAGLGVTATIPVGSDVGAYEGVAQAARFIAGQPGRVNVYHDRLGWHLDYYLYGSTVKRSWFDSPEKLARELRASPRKIPLRRSGSRCRRGSRPSTRTWRPRSKNGDCPPDPALK